MKNINSKFNLLIIFFVISTIISFMIIVETNPFEQKITTNSIISEKRVEKRVSYESSNPDLTRIAYQINIELEANAKDISFSSYSTYRNDENKTIENIVHIIDIDTIFVESRISTISVLDSQGELYFEWLVLPDYQLLNITLRNSLFEEQLTSFTVNYLLEDAVLSNPEILDNYIVRWSFTNHELSNQFSIILDLPAKFQLYNSSFVPALEPEADYVSIDGTRFEWNYHSLALEEILSWTIRFQVTTDQGQIEVYIPTYVWILMAVLFLIGIIIGGLSVFFYMKTQVDVERTEIVDTLLSQPEKEILKIIKDEGRVTTQSKICSISGFSKAKVSYYINELERKEIISRERWGRMNRIRLVDESFDKVFYQNPKIEEK